MENNLFIKCFPAVDIVEESR